MKSTNYYKRVLSVISLVLLLLLTLSACADPSEGGNGTTPPPAQGGTGDVGGSADKGETTGGTSGGASVDPSGTTGTPSNPGTPSDTAGGSNPTPSDPTGTTGTSGTNPGGSGIVVVPGGSGSGSSATNVQYTVTVVDGAGNPLKNVIVKFYKDGADTGKMGSTNSSGVAKVTLAAATYTFTLEVVGGGDKYTYDESACVVCGTTTTSVTVKMLEKTNESTEGTEMIFANEKDYKAIVAGETNGMIVSIPEGDMLYVIFVPSREGLFSFSATANGKTIDCGYYGGTFNVLANKVDGGVKGEYQVLNVRNDNLGASYVLGFKTADGSAAEATLSITRTGDSIPDAIASAPWQDIHASADLLVEYTGSTAGTLTDFDITDASLSIVKGSDGYYHLGSESGPVIMLRVDSASPYLGAFSDMSANGNVAVYEFEADGSLKKKTRYNYMIDEYVEVANKDGVVPLNDELIAMVKAVGDYKGWWDTASANYRFDVDENGNSINEVASLVHLFACCYYK